MWYVDLLIVLIILAILDLESFGKTFIAIKNKNAEPYYHLYYYIALLQTNKGELGKKYLSEHIDMLQKVAENACSVVFRLKLKAGKKRLQTWFMDDKGDELCGAYYVHVKRLWP